MPIGDEGCAVQSAARAQTDTGSDVVAGVADCPGEPEYREMSWGRGVDKASDRLIAGDTGADEDRSDDRQTGPSLGHPGVQRESDPQGDGRERIAEVVDQVREQGDAAAGEKHGKLSDGGQSEDGERERDGADALPRALDALVYQAMGVAVLAIAKAVAMVVAMVVVLAKAVAMVVVWVIVAVRVMARPTERLGSPQARAEMAVGAAVGVAVDTFAVPVSVRMCTRRNLRSHGIKLAQRSSLQCAGARGSLTGATGGGRWNTNGKRDARTARWPSRLSGMSCA